MSGSFAVSTIAWALLVGYLVIAGVIVFETDFRTPRNNPASHLVVCVVALVFAAAWPLRAVQRIAQRKN
jgi:hypothetical protein